MKIEVKVLNKDKLELLQDASKGDIIDLNDLTTIDTSLIVDAIEKGKDAIYNKKLEEMKIQLSLEKDNEYSAKIQKDQYEYQLQLESLKNQLESLQAQFNDKVSLEKVTIQKELSEGFEKTLSEKEEQIDKLKDEKHALELTVAAFNATKASLNVKMTGEELERECDSEALKYMQNGLSNCTWYKDNKVVTDPDEEKGSKADFIFKVFVDDTHTGDPLASVCLEMKAENPNSKNTKKDSDYFKQLDKNRIKKGCEYAVLVSNLELNDGSKPPLYKVLEYENMYVVRPKFMMILLNIITSLTLKAKGLILNSREEAVKVLSKQHLMEKFEELKFKYITKPIEKLNSELTNIRTNCENINKAKNNIEKACDNMETAYINKLVSNLEKFNIEMEKEYKKAGLKDEELN